MLNKTGFSAETRVRFLIPACSFEIKTLILVILKLIVLLFFRGFQ